MAANIRRAEAADVAAIFAIRTAVLENHMDLAELAAEGVTPATVAAWLQGTGAGWIGYLDETPSGFAMARRAQGDLFALFVLPHAEGHGLGTMLLAAAENWLARQGVDIAWLLTGGGFRLRAPGFYESRGWVLHTQEPGGDLRYVKRVRT